MARRRQDERWEQWEVFNDTSGHERIVEEEYYENGNIRSRRTVERTTGGIHAERRGFGESLKGAEWDKGKALAVSGNDNNEEIPTVEAKQIESRFSRAGTALVDATASGAKWFGRKMWREVLAGRSK